MISEAMPDALRAQFPSQIPLTSIIDKQKLSDSQLEISTTSSVLAMDKRVSPK